MVRSSLPSHYFHSMDKHLLTPRSLANHMPGTLHWSVGYFTKLEFAQRKPEPKQALKPIAEATTHEDRKLEKKEKEEEKEIAEKDPPKDVFHTRPDEECVSGILSLTVHQIMELGAFVFSSPSTCWRDEMS